MKIWKSLQQNAPLIVLIGAASGGCYKYGPGLFNNKIAGFSGESFNKAVLVDFTRAREALLPKPDFAKALDTGTGQLAVVGIVWGVSEFISAKAKKR